MDATNYINNMKNRKAGLPAIAIVTLILIMILMIVMFLFESRMDELRREETGKAICKASVKTHALSNIGLDFASDINCPTERLTIREDDEEAIMHELAMAKYNCFDQFHRGELDLFSDAHKLEKYCVICHVIDFKAKKNIPLENFMRYERTHNIKPGGMSFEEFFIGHSTYDEFPEYESPQRYGINTELQYTTVFTYAKEGYWSKWITGAAGATIGSVVLSVALIPFTGGGSILVGIAGLAGGAGGGMLGYTIGSDKTADWNASILLIPYNADLLRDLTCTVAPAGQEE